MNRAFKILLSLSLLANVWLGSARLLGPSAATGSPGTARMNAPERSAADRPSSSLVLADASSASAAPQPDAKRARLLLPASTLSQLLVYDDSALRVGPAFADAFDLNSRQADELNAKLSSWIARVKEMERAGLELFTEESGSHYRITVDPEERERLFTEITREIREIEGCRQADTIASVLLAHRRLSTLRHDQHISFNRTSNGETRFKSDEIEMISPSAAMFESARARYGHLIDFSADPSPSR